MPGETGDLLMADDIPVPPQATSSTSTIPDNSVQITPEPPDLPPQTFAQDLIVLDDSAPSVATTNTSSSAALAAENGKEEPLISGVTSPLTSKEIVEQFYEYAQGLSDADYIKKFYAIRVDQEDFRARQEYCCLSACSPLHFARNRYRDILPYDFNRVSLKESEDNPDGYMNASFVQLEGSQMRFIAAQAPLQTTLDEWWQLVDEQNVTLIVMLCKLMEMNKVKCERYWPNTVGEHEVFGNYEVTLEAYEKFDDDEYVLRKLTMENQVTGVSRTVHQLHYREWPDHGCPSGEVQLINFIDKVAEIHNTVKDAPVLVHCSAGVGRTGTIIAINHARELITNEGMGSIDISQFVRALRRQRASMVQTQDQYQFVHRCVLYYCRKYLGLPQPEKPTVPKKELKQPASTRDVSSSDSDIESEGTIVPDFPHEPPAPTGVEEFSVAN